MTHHTIRPTTPVGGSTPSTAVVPTPTNPTPAGSSTRAGNPLASGRNAGASSLARRVGLPAMPAKVLQQVIDHSAASARTALARTSRAMAAQVAIHAADAAEDFARAAAQALALGHGEQGEAAVALAGRFAARIGHLDLKDVVPSYETVTDLLKGLPKAADSLGTALGVGRSMLQATERAVDWMLHAPHDKASLRDQLSLQVTASLKSMAGALRHHGVVHDEPAMDDLLNRLMGPKGSVLSAQVALSELPQHALDLPATPDGDAQTARMLTRLAEHAVTDAGLEALRSDPSWGPFLADDRIGAVLQKRDMDLANHPGLKRAVDTLRDRAETLRQEAETPLAEAADQLREQAQELVKAAI